MAALGGNPSRSAAVTGEDLGFEHVYQPGTSGWTLLLLHGTGGDEHDLLPLGRQLAPGAALLSPRGKVLENGMPRYFRRLAIGSFDLPDLIERTDELAQFISAAQGQYDLDPTRILALGYSNGANIAVSVLFRHPALLRGAALLRPTLPYEPETIPAPDATDVLIGAGEGDPYSSPDRIERLAEILRAGGARVTLHTEPRTGHALTQNDLAQAARWVAAVTHGQP
jgi:phospholipase/carboxylesterase